MIAEDGGNFELQPWDWRYYAEKRRQALYDFDESALRAHLQLDNVIAAAFDVAGRLFGLKFEERHDVDLPHPDARAWEAKDAQGRHVALFIGDFFARPEKHSGAWMSCVPRSAPARRRRDPDRRQRAQRGARRQGRAGAAEPRRGAHPVPRVRPRPARHAVRRDLSLSLRHQRRARFRGAAVAALRALARPARGAVALRPPLRDRRADAAGPHRPHEAAPTPTGRRMRRWNSSPPASPT